MKEDIDRVYGGKIRVRACGICIENNSLLLVRHSGIGKHNELWIPPGGGVDYLEGAEKALQREFKEEVNLAIAVKELLFVNEYMEAPLHAVELFFKVEIIGGKLTKGQDPEHTKGRQLIEEVGFVTFKEIAIMDNEKLHSSLHNIQSKESLLNMRGYFHFYP